MCDADVKIHVINVVQRGQKGATEVERVHGSGSSRLTGRSLAKSSRLARPSHSDDTDANSSWNDSAERECCDQGTSTYSSHSGKDSAMETTESKSSNSPSPPSSSGAYSLLSGGSEQDQPSTSGYSSERPARLQTQKELLRALRELKMRLPTDQRAKGCSSTLNSLRYALKCVKQVRANQEYYHQWSIEESQGCCLDLSTFTIEELDNITSEYTLQNPDTFSVAVSFLSGKVVYISPHASSPLHCKQEKLQGALFSELLAPQDIRTFYSGTAPCHLPLWACSTRAGSTVDGVQEKPMFCRLSGGRDCAGDVMYCPFRLTPSKLSLRASDTAQPEPCCLLIAERVHSGYEAPRIPTDKRIFTTSHTPNCLFQEVDERAVPLLGYLPQDLIGTPLLLYLHPEDRSVMVDIHKKVVQYAGKPFEHSSLRMWARSGEYLTVDTSWSSFINPWSRKVAFIVGRHKVRTSPLNEDVFTATGQGVVRAPSPEVTLLSEQIHRILVPPIHCSSALLYSSVGSSGADSSDNNTPPARDRPSAGRVNPPQMCDDVPMQCSEQQVYTTSCNKATPLKTTCTGDIVNPAGTECTSREIQQVATHGPKSQVSTLLPGKGLPVTYSYQQINCLDSIIRYLESCNVPNTVKRKCGSSSCTTSSTSDDGKHRKAAGLGEDMVNTLQAAEGSKIVPMEPTHPLTPLALHYKAESVVSVTSQCSFSSTIVHVGDKKPPESDILMMEESLTTPTPATPASAPQNCTSSRPPGATPQTVASPRTAASETESKRGGGGVSQMGLTKEVLSNHTEREEQDFLSRFSDLSQLYLIQSSKPPCKNTTMPGVKGTIKGIRNSQDYPPSGGSGRRRGRRGKRIKHQSESPFMDTQALPTPGPRVPQASSAKGPSASVFPSSQDMCVGPQPSNPPWPASVSTQAHGLPIPSPYPPDCLPFYPLYPSFPVPPVQGDPRMQTGSPSSQVDSRMAMQSSHILPAAAAPPVMAFIMPGCMFPHLSGAGTQLATSVQHLGQNGPEPIQLNHLPAQFSPGVGHMTLDTMSLNQFNPPSSQLNASPAQLAVPLQFYNPNVTFGFQNRAPEAPSPATAIAVPPHRGPSRSSTPQSTNQLAEHEGAGSPLFNSRCSSPLNLLQLEEIPSNRTDATLRTPPPGGCLAQGVHTSVTCSSSKDNTEVNESNQDAMSTSSDLLDLLLHEDSRSGTSSAASGFGTSGSASNGCSTAGSGTRSNNTSKYFGSVESSEHDQGLKAACGEAGEEHFMKYVLQEPAWLVMANTDEEVMMTYQLPSRDRETVLQKDRETLKSVHMQQPLFTEQQCKELSEVHPWLQSGLLPTAVTASSCRGCGSPTEAASAPPFDLELTEMDFSGDLREEGNLASSAVVPWRRGEDRAAEPNPAAKACGETEVTSSGEVQGREP